MIRKSFCEIFLAKYSTAIRVMIAIELMEKFGLSQLRASRLAGIPQPILNYVINDRRKIRGLKELYNNPKISKLIKSIAEDVYRGLDIDMCAICLLLRKSNAISEALRQSC